MCASRKVALSDCLRQRRKLRLGAKGGSTAAWMGWVGWLQASWSLQTNGFEARVGSMIKKVVDKIVEV